MTRNVLAIALLGVGMLLSSPAEAQNWRCEDRAANCIGRCTDRAAGISWRCDRQLVSCMIHANLRRYRSW
jgi:hypothetical protein